LGLKNKKSGYWLLNKQVTEKEFDDAAKELME